MYLINPFRTYWKARKYFKRPKPILVFYNPGFTVFNHFIDFVTDDVCWKDKYGSPRHERSPFISLKIWKWYFTIIFDYERDYHNIDSLDYWEQILWLVYYCNGDIEKAEKEWPWTDLNDKSTWNKKYLK